MFGRILCFPPIGDVVREALALTHGKIGLFFSLPVAILAITAIPSGRFTDKVGPRTAAGIGAILMAAGSLASSAVSAFWPLFLWVCLFGIGFSMSFSSLPKLVGLWFPSEKVGLATGIYVTGIAIGVAVALGTTRAVIFPVTNSYQGTFLIWSIPLVLGTILWWLFVREPPVSSTAPQKGQPLVKGAASEHVWKNRSLWFAALAFFFQNLQFYTWTGWAPHLMILKGASPETAGLMISLLSWVSIPFMFLTPWFSHKVGLVRPFILASSVGYMLAAFAAMYINVSYGWPLMVFLGLVVSVFPLLLALPVDLVPREWVGLASGMAISVSYLGSLAGPWLTGHFLDLTGTMVPALVILMGSGVAMGVFGLLVPETGWRARPKKLGSGLVF
jgi:CP family cyanate transporter-like MFS transporter